MANFQFLVKLLSGQTRCLNFKVENEATKISTLQIKEKIQELEGIKVEEQRLIANNKELSDKFLFSPLLEEPNNAFTFILSLSSRLMGGKGGFGALLRGAGTKMGKRKFNNNDDCRDLNGRRLKHVKAEKELLEWLAQKKNEGTEKKKEEKKKPTEPQHQFDGTGYFNELEEITDSVTSSVEKGLHSSKQNKSVAEPQKKKRRTVWGEMDDLFEDDGSSDEVENQEQKTEEPIINEKDKNDEKSTHQKSDVKEEKLESQIERKEEQKEEEDDINVIYKEIQKEVSKYSNEEELQTLGLEKLKDLLTKIGFKSGGTLKERSIRLFTVKEVDYEKLDQKLFAKPAKRNGKK